tara:strand:+ start:352 stop:504 length:153 start_codon:yes stop_codon:yes gene_type:complete
MDDKRTRTRTVKDFTKNFVAIVGIWSILGPAFVYALVRYHRQEERKRKGK